ncbi:hypothetical protein PENFLA_c027G07606 [Penicillium flavigenum]|uniref:Retroviral polymerase SH3-like domain-containing protein n=1 Tax=Penicillium flavigenum TaxID=254877 RepID=A0A1V6SRB3_9EURO|nr:hypothetical protein PENFLA_c027G07606 [Penicillium flavigenum]
MHPRAEIGFLVGYRASNIWKIWFPHSGKVKHIRDAVINKTRKYAPKYDQYKPIPLPLVRQPQELTTEEITQVINHEITSQQTSTMEESQGMQDRDNHQQHDSQQDNHQQAQENPQQAQDAPQEVIQEATSKASAQRETTPTPPGAFPEDQDLPPLPITPPQEEEANTSSGQGVDIQADQEDPAHQDQTQYEDQAQHEPTPNPIEDELERQLQSKLLAPSREIGTATPREIHLYQQKVGSAGYTTTITRPDATKATARLAQFLTNPGPQHQQAANRVITYLYTTRNLAIEYSAGAASAGMDSVQFASDTSYGDHSNRRSSARYICQAYGGPVD